MTFAQWMEEVNEYLDEANIATGDIEYPYYYAYDNDFEPEDIAGELLCDNFGH